LKLRKKAAEEGGPKVPGYIVTYSDMVTLLLTFFVMLLSLSTVQDPELFNKGRDSFLESLRCVGLGIFFGRREMPHLGYSKMKYYISDPEEASALRSLDAREEDVRRSLAKLAKHMKITESQIVAEKTNFSITNIHFCTGESILNEAAKKFLREFCLHLQQGLSTRPIKLYVLGLACDAATEKQQWILSARRAQIVADYIRDNLPPASRPTVFCLGAGPGGNWVRQDSPIYRQSHILIGIMR